MKQKHLCLLVIVTLTLVFGATPVWGQSDYKIRTVTFDGNKTLSKAELEKLMNTRDKTLKDKLLFWKKHPRFSISTFREDLSRLRKRYQQLGHLNPVIETDLQSNDGKKRVWVHLTISEGAAVLIDSVQYRLLVNKPVNAIADSVLTEIKTKPGQTFKDEDVLHAIDIFTKALSDKGYPFATVDQKLELSPDTAKVKIYYLIDPGNYTKFGSTYIGSNQHVTESFIRSKLKYSEGDQYSKALLEKSQQKLYDTGLFQFVVVRSLRDSISGEKLPVVIQMSEKPRWSVETGVGYGSTDRFRLSALVTRRQFLGGAREIDFKIKHSYYTPLEAEVEFIQPDFLSNNTKLAVSPFYSKEKEISYQVERIGGDISLQHSLSGNLKGYFTISLESNQIDIRIEGRDGLYSIPAYNKGGFSFGQAYRATDDLLNPTKGTVINSYLTWIGPLLKNRYHYLKAEADLRKYLKFDDNWNLALRLRLGIMKPIQGDTLTPIADRFLLGGAQSLRGWSNNAIGAGEYIGTTIGGNNLLELGAELRFPIYNIISGVVFADAGNVWKKPFYYNLKDMNYDAGAGLRIKTPIGPVRLDYAMPLFTGHFRGIFILSIGQAF